MWSEIHGIGGIPSKATLLRASFSTILMDIFLGNGEIVRVS